MQVCGKDDHVRHFEILISQCLAVNSSRQGDHTAGQ